MNQGLKSLYSNNTWSLAPLPKGKKAVGSKWVFKIKRKVDGMIERYKARLVAKGYSQVEGLDYNETSTQVAKFTTVLCLLAISAIKGGKLHQMDVDNAFLHGDLDEEVFTKTPQGMKFLHDSLVCELHKSLYGLKQVPQQWFGKLSTFLLNYGFKQSPWDYSLFTLDGDNFLVVIIYVDDLIIAGNNGDRCVQFKKYFQTCFKIKDLGPLHYFLGLEVRRSQDGIHVNQKKKKKM